MHEPITIQSPPRIAPRWRSARRSDRQLLTRWLHLRLLLCVWAALVSTLRPLTLPERTVALWPPHAPVSAWLGRVLLWPWLRWDAEYYLKIVERGYRADDGTAQFHPLLAWLATPLAWMTGQPLLALLVVSSLAGALMILALERLARIDLGPRSPIAASIRSSN